MLKTIYKTIKNEKLKGYKGRRVKGLYGAVMGLYSYYRNKRYDYDKRAYVNYYMVRTITGRDL